MCYGSVDSPTDDPNIIGGVQFQLLTPTNVDPPVYQLTCTSTSSPTTVQWTINGSPVSGYYASSQIVTDRPASTYNTLTVTGTAPGMYAGAVTTTCSSVCAPLGYTLNPRSTISYQVSNAFKSVVYLCASIQVLLPHPLLSLLCSLVPHLSVSLTLRWSSEQI